MSFDQLNPPITPRVVEGLEPWIASRQLQLPSNIEALSPVLRRLHMATVAYQPETQEILVVGPDKVAYASVTQEAIDSRSASLRELYARGIQIPYLALSSEGQKFKSAGDAEEEAKVRLLALGLGIASLRMATHASTPKSFNRSVRDAIQSFGLPNHPIVSFKNLNVPDSGQTLLYGFKRAAKAHKNLSREEAAALVKGMSTIARGSWHWYQKQGVIYETEIGNDSPGSQNSEAKVRTTKAQSELTKIIAQYQPTDTRVVVYDPALGAYQISPFTRFARHYLDDTAKYDSAEAQLAALHGRHVGSSREPFPSVAEEDLSDAISMGVQAYLRACRGNEAADNMADILAPLTTRNLAPIIVLGNLVVRKLSSDPEVPAEFKREMPGVSDSTIGICFEAIRNAIHGAQGRQEEGVVKQLGELVKAFINQTVPQASTA